MGRESGAMSRLVIRFNIRTICGCRLWPPGRSVKLACKQSFNELPNTRDEVCNTGLVPVHQPVKDRNEILIFKFIMHAPSCVYLVSVSRVGAVRSLRRRFVSARANKVINISQLTVASWLPESRDVLGFVVAAITAVAVAVFRVKGRCIHPIITNR